MNEPDFEGLREDLRVLTARSLTMNQELAALSGALVHVNELQAQQHTIEQTAKVAANRVEEVAANSATLDDLAELQRQRRIAVRNWYIALAVSFLCVLAIGIGGVAASTAYSHQQDRFAHAQYNNCVTRNKSAAASRGLIADLIKAEQSSIDPATATQLITALRQAEATSGVANCDALLKG